MSRLTVTFAGCGDAFGSGGRMQTCILFAQGELRWLLDCGASSLIALKRLGVDPHAIGLILLSHLHGDHFGGLPFYTLDGQFNRRTAPLTVAGPPGTRQRVEQAMEVFYPGSTGAQRRFAVEFAEWTPGQPWRHGPVTVTPYEVRHASGAPPFALRVECGGVTVAYTGDTEWVESLIPAATGADLLIAEALFFDKQVKYHLDLATLRRHERELGARRIVLTHMGAEMLAHASAAGIECAEDGMVIALGSPA